MPAARTGQLVALRLPPGQEFLDALEAAWAAGGAVLPIDPLAPRAVGDSLVAAMCPDQPVEDGVALVIATSGSTGVPKGAQLSHSALEASIRACHARIGHEPDDVWLSCLPWHHIGGLQVMLRARMLGIPLVIHDRFDPDRVAAADASLTSLVPTQLARLLDAGVDLRKFRTILLGGAAAAVPLLERARAAGAKVVTTYGMSETAGGCVYDGRPLDGVEVTTDADGRLRIRGPMLMSGYRCRPDLTGKTLVDGWLRTSDHGAITDGTVVVHGRIDDVVVTGGENVATGRVAAALHAHPALADVEVVGVQDPQWGQRIVAAVVAAPGFEVPRLDELRDWCADSLTPAERPRQVLALSELPRLSSGKVDRLALSRLAAAVTDA
jgi:O-succinylbenzoic acid--CoA ligase